MSPYSTRRDWLRSTGLGFGSLALTHLLAQDGKLLAGETGRLDPTKLKGPAKHVILLFMGGGPSQVDTFDPKPELSKLQGKDVPESIAKHVPKANRLRLNNLYGSPWTFKSYGQSGIPVSELLPETAQCVDDLCILRSMAHTIPVHPSAEYLTMTGSSLGTRPSLGAWLYYGLGSSNQDLPGFIVLLADENYGGPAAWGTGFLPAKYQGTVVNSMTGIPHIQLPKQQTTQQRRQQLDVLQDLNRQFAERIHNTDSELEARIQSYEMAFRMQTQAPEAFDLSKETEETKKLYGLDRPDCAEFARNCLLARRLVERGVRFIQLNHGGWDAHGNVKENHTKYAKKTDRPTYGLITDLKQRGLLENTLVIWGGEFGRTPTAEGNGQKPGRDHNPLGYTMWLAGGGVKGGQIIGQTDDLGYTAVEHPIHPNDLHATILHAIGIDQRQLYFEHHNRKEIVTVNGGKVIEQVFRG